MKKNLLILSALLLLSLANVSAKELTISTNSWIGYTPLFYANEKGYLKKLDIKLITSHTLAQAADLYMNKKADMVTTTQHEYYAIKRAGHSIIPVILFDRSNGADLVLSNKSIKELQKANHIEAYLKTNSINREVLKEFLNHYNLNHKELTLINKEPKEIIQLQPKKDKNMLIVTFIPYNESLQKNGFRELASTKESSVLIVVDALCTNQKTLNNDKKRLYELKKIIDKSISEIQNNKKASYTLVKDYLDGLSYAEYIHALNLIKWINKPSQTFLKEIEKLRYNKEQLIEE